MEALAILIGLGFFVGLIVGATGVGGGSIMTPVLIFFYNLSPVAAVATDLIFAAVTKLISASTHQKKGKVNWKICTALWLGSLPTAAIGAILVSQAEQSDFVLEGMPIIIAIVVLFSAFSLLTSSKLERKSAVVARSYETFIKKFRLPLSIITGIIVGGLVTLTSVGAGVLGTVAIIYLYPHKMTSARIVATDTVHAIPLALIAGGAYAFTDKVQWAILLPLLGGSIAGAFLGARLIHHLPDRLVRTGLAAVLCLAAVMILFK